ncbi:MAG: primosomal protein N' [Candidatus Omnitrophica bacterium CG11_big_fil_rev_8_21_14_0_20_45_26]|uniref:Replication restart protein PriA n=1 Tax=Candidatus Abzuiibacterium crystallinum TaxID=1974748 RepID=A0A2H0LUY0_9BACT|nr:MAG: primosomal protein N' [Candidatus Omnitrophica bacterium CG11_big_fil_rev_8_21_14_0_20_45_26]PIW65054.1 MAG: primosomal protein N' [Candidatus Omnitrophica bacterium CG12_big_fil_rev_8_21_14_0_65_45_16]
MNTTPFLFATEKILTAQVAVSVPANDPFSYEIPSELLHEVKVGARVLVPFKNRQMIGYVVQIEEITVNRKLKKIVEVLDQEIYLSDHFIRLTQYISHYYFSSWGEAIQAVLPKPFRRQKKVKYRSLTAVPPAEVLSPARFQLTDEQAAAFQKIGEQLQSNQYAANLLFGVTGSGKSEIYIRAIQEAIRLGKTAICLVPEIALTEQLKRFFSIHFGHQLEIIHSKLSEGERWFAWERIRTGERKVVLGARSAIFAPLSHLGLIIIDEEHEHSYKQDQNPRYHAREIAKWRARDLNAVLVLGSATPAMESLLLAEKGEYQLLELTKRVDSKKLPSIEIVDLNQAAAIARERVIISPKLQSAIKTALERNEGVLLLLNRRGYATQAHSPHSGELLMCRYCDVPLTFHQSLHQFVCHYCNYRLSESQLTDGNQTAPIKFFGVGTERVESEVARFFPTARLGRLDSDSAKLKEGHLPILEKFRKRQIDILVGTQMIAKGFDFPHVTLVGVILADTALALPDFRSSERTFQLLTQVAGRSGRGDREGKVIVQTYSPYHFSIQLAQKHDMREFFQREMVHREKFKYPPYKRLINIVVRSKKEQKAIEQIQALKKLLHESLDPQATELLGPAPLPFYKLRGQYRWHLIIKADLSYAALHQEVKKSLQALKKSNLVYIVPDMDPLAVL